MEDTMNLNAELFRQLSYIVGNENAMKKAVRYLKKLAVQMKETTATEEEEEEYRPRRKAEVLADFDQACKELKLNLEGKLELKSLEEALDEL